MERRGGLIATCSAVPSVKGDCFYVSTGHSIATYDLTTKRLIRTRISPQNSISCLLPHKNGNQVYLASSDGVIQLWDLEEDIVLFEYELGRPVAQMVTAQGREGIFLNLSEGVNSKGVKEYAEVCFTDIRESEEVSRLVKLKTAGPLAVSASGEYLVVADRRRIRPWLASQDPVSPLRLYCSQNIVSIAIDTHGNCIAAGDVTGRISIWHEIQHRIRNPEWIGGDGETAKCTVVHWHAQAAKCLCFSSDSTQLLSGGMEGVLVAWQLGSNARRYLPRLSGPLQSIAAVPNRAAHFLVTQSNNVVRVVNLAMAKVEGSVYGVQRPFSEILSSFATDPVVCLLPGSGELVIAGENSTLQFYDAYCDRHISRLQVLRRNSVSVAPADQREFSGGHQAPIEPLVSHICFSGDASCMSTVDVRPDAGPGKSHESTLRFWTRAAAGPSAPNQFTLHTIVHRPHRGEVTGLAFHPTEEVVASVALPGELRLWTCLRPSSKQQARWQCRAAASYQGWAMHSVAFSVDGSLVAVGTKHCVTLWCPHSATLLASLQTPASSGDLLVSRLLFVPGTPFLAGVGKGVRDVLVVWNVLAAAVWWWLPLAVKAIAADPRGTGQLAVAVEGSEASGTVALFQAAQPTPLQLWHIPWSAPCAVFFVPPGGFPFKSDEAAATHATSPILIMTQDCCYAITNQQDLEILSTAEDGQEDAPHEVSAYHEIGEVPEKNLQILEDAGDVDDFKLQTAALFNTPSHLLPSTLSLAPLFLDLCSRQNPKGE